MHQQQPVAAFGLIEISSRDQYRYPLEDQRVKDAPKFAARDRIDASGGLIEQQQLRRVDQGTGNAKLAFHTAGELAGQTISKPGHTRSLEQMIFSWLPHGPAYFEDVGIKADVLGDGEILVEAELLGHVADSALDRFRPEQNVLPVDKDDAGIGGKHSRENPQRRRFPRAVGTHQPKDLPFARVEAQVVHGDDLTETFRQSADLHDFVAHGDPGALSSMLASAGIPGLSSWLWFSMSILILYTKVTRSAWVSTLLGVNSAFSEIIEMRPTYFCPG